MLGHGLPEVRFRSVGVAANSEQRSAVGGDRRRPGGAGIVGELFEFARPGQELAGVPIGPACRLQAVQRGQAPYGGMPEPPEVVHRCVCVGGPGGGNTLRPLDEVGDGDTDDADRLPRPQAFQLPHCLGAVLAAAQRG